jgi:putative membrane protein
MMFGGGMMLFGWLFLVAVVVLVVWLVRSAVGSTGDRARPGAPDEKAAVRILEERFARGEIGKEEFEERRRELRGGR